MKRVFRGPRMACKRLTNGATCCSLMAAENKKANRAECGNTPHGSNPTLGKAVTGLHSIIQNHGTPVLCGFRGPTDSFVGLGRFVVPGWERV
jgi:hypothetical protein